MTREELMTREDLRGAIDLIEAFRDATVAYEWHGDDANEAKYNQAFDALLSLLAPAPVSMTREEAERLLRRYDSDLWSEREERKKEIIDAMTAPAPVECQAENLRQWLWLNHGCDCLYGDDGEMQCNNIQRHGFPPLDFKRDSLHSLLTKLGYDIGPDNPAPVEVECPRCGMRIDI